MAQSQTGFVDSTRASGAQANAGLSDQAVNFRFIVTWSCLAIAADPPKAPTPVSSPAPRVVPPAPQPVPAEAPPITPPSSLAPVAVPAPSAAPISTTTTALVPASKNSSALTAPKKSAGGSFQWEMVVPKMVRSAKKATPRPKAPVETPPPNLYTASSSLRKSFSLKLCAAVIAAAAIVVPVWRRAAHTGSNTVQTPVEGGDWQRESAVGGDPGVKQSRQLVLYRPALQAKDARLEFAWTVASGDVGLVFRAKDLGNYYAVRLKLLKPGPTPTLSAEYFSVYQFVESPHTEKVLVFSKNDPVLLVRLDIFGPSFTLYLQDNATEFWTDARMTSGALGFFEEGNRSAEVRGLRMSFPERSQLLRRPLDEIHVASSQSGGD
jgi:hypothetical protein